MLNQAEIRYVHMVEDITPEHLEGFFEQWPYPPSPETHLRILENSDHVVLTVAGDSGNVIGFVTAISDRILSAVLLMTK